MCDRENMFIGRISASLTHEIKNVLAIIRESSGLMQDLLALSKDGAFTYHEKFNSILSAIQEQVNRGVELTARLNRFAHSTDQPLVDLDLNDLVAQVVLLMERFARLRKVQLQAQRSDGALSLNTDPFRLQMVLAAGVDCLLQTAEAGAVIEMQPEVDGRRLLLRRIPAAGTTAEPLPADTLEAAFEPLQDFLQKLRVTPAPANTTTASGLSLTFAR